MTNMEILELFGEVQGSYVLEAQQLRIRKRKHISTRKLWILAAAVITALALSLTAYAAIHARIRMQMIHTEVPQTKDIAPLCAIYPQSIPEDYRLTSGGVNSAQVRELYYWNDSGMEIGFALSVKQDLLDIPLNPAGQKMEATVSENKAILHEYESTRWLIWENAEGGYTAYLHTDDPSVDLFAMAESVDEGEPLPESFAATETNELWYPQWMPEGYRMEQADPVTDGVQMIEYTRRLENGDADYIQYIVSLTWDLSDIGEAPHSTMTWENVDIAGTPGRMVTIGDHQRLLFWKNEAEGFNAELMTEDMDADLIAIAIGVGPGEKLEIAPEYTRNPAYSVRIAQENAYVAFEPWYPQWLPQGYEIAFVSDRFYGDQEIRYTNGENGFIQYVLHYRLGKWDRGYSGDLEPKEVNINGIAGYLIENESNRFLIWVNEEKGFGFTLSTGADVDILAIARSVALGEEIPATNAGKTAEALVQLGQYRITALPEGMQEDGLAGWPKENSGDGYAYVRRCYIHPGDNRQIVMEYETYTVDSLDSDLQEIACRNVGTNGRPAQIGNFIGAAAEFEGHTTVSWFLTDEANDLLFHLYSDDFTAEELISAAVSVKNTPE